MDQPQQTPSSSSRPQEASSQAAETTAHAAPSIQQHQPPSTNANSSVASIPSSTAPPSPSLTSNPNPTQITRPLNSPSQQQQQQILSQSLTRPSSATYSRPWQQHSTFSQFSSPLPATSSQLLSSSSASGSSSHSLAISGKQRAGMAIGVPASPLPSPSPLSPSQPSTFTGSYGQQFGGLGRGALGVSESTTNSNVSQARPMQGTQGIGMMGTLGSGSQMRPSGMSVLQHQQRPVQSSLRPISSPSSQPPAAQNFQGHSLMRASPAGSSGVQSSNTPQNTQSLNQPWLSSSSQGKPPLPPPSYRPQMNLPSMQQRAHVTQQQQQQQQQLTPTSTSQPQQQQSPPRLQPQEQLHQPQGQLQSLRSPQQPLSHQHQLTRVQGPVIQKPTSQVATTQPSVAQPGSQGKTALPENEESGTCILGKRSIQELLQQIDPSEKLDPEVADILVDIAEDFAASIITSGCSLAKHRKSDTLEAKDILLHVERNWNMRPPGFSSDEIKTYRKPLTTDIHKERLTAVKKTMMAAEAANARNPIGQGTANAKSGQAKTPANSLASLPLNR